MMNTNFRYVHSYHHRIYIFTYIQLRRTRQVVEIISHLYWIHYPRPEMTLNFHLVQKTQFILELFR